MNLLCSAERLTLLGAIYDGDADELEAALHSKFIRARRHGEWFEPVPELLAYIARHALDPDAAWDRYMRALINRRVVVEAVKAMGLDVPVTSVGVTPPRPAEDPTRFMQTKTVKGGRKAILAAYKAARGIT